MKLQASPQPRTPNEILVKVYALQNQLAKSGAAQPSFKAKDDPALKIYSNNLAIRIEELCWVLGIIPPFNKQNYDA